MNALLCFLAIFGAVAVSASNFVSLDELHERIDELRHEFFGVINEMSDLRTVAAVNSDKLAYIKKTFLFRNPRWDERQSKTIQSYKDQIKTIGHDVDNAIARADKFLTMAKGLNSSLNEQKDDLLDIASTDVQQAADLQELIHDLEQLETEFNENRDMATTAVRTELTDEHNDVKDLETFVDERVCEYGEGVFDPTGYEMFVPFKVVKDSTPELFITLSGWVAHADGYGYESYTALSVDKYPTYANTTGFTVQPSDLSTDKVVVKEIYCQYMACVLPDRSQELTD